jgi:hypothetical protein
MMNISKSKINFLRIDILIKRITPNFHLGVAESSTIEEMVSIFLGDGRFLQPEILF